MILVWIQDQVLQMEWLHEIITKILTLFHLDLSIRFSMMSMAKLFLMEKY